MAKKQPLFNRRIFLITLMLGMLTLTQETLHNLYLFHKVGSNTVFITNPPGAKYQGSATGFEIKAPSGKVYTLTNQHVCELQKDGFLLVEEKQNSGRLIPRRVLEVYDDNDLCLVEGLEGYDGLKLASSYSIGDYNWAIGYPMGEALNISSGFLKELGPVELIVDIPLDKCEAQNLHKKKIQFLIFEMEVCMITRKAIQTNIPIFPGNSGSPMLNWFGNVTGVVFAANGSTNWGSSVPLEDVVTFLKPY